MALIDQVKRKLDITWVDEETDQRVADIMGTAQETLRHVLGVGEVEYNFEAKGLENMLFLSLCLYMFNHAEHEFQLNYANEIAQCRAMHEVSYYKTQEGEGDAATS